MRESKIEAYLKKRVEETGGLCYKWTGVRGAPDRIVMWNHQVFDWFVELKTKGGRLSVLQQRRHTELRSLGRKVAVIWNVEQVDNFVFTQTATPHPGYRRVRPNEAGYELIYANQQAGNWVCDSWDHNEREGCSNPACFKHPK